MVKSEMDVVGRLRALCMTFPEAHEKPFSGHEAPAWRIRDKMFVMMATGDGRLSFWCKALPGAQDVLVDGSPERYFIPPYVGSKGWIGVRLDVDGVEWGLIDELVRDSYVMTAPKRLGATVKSKEEMR